MKKRYISLVIFVIAAILTATQTIAQTPEFSQPKPFSAGLYTQPSQASRNLPEPMSKGTVFYPEFANVPDYAAFAKLDASGYIYYNTTYGDFYYLDNINLVYSYSSKVYDYFNVTTSRLNEYKAFLERLGFEYSETIAEAISPDNREELDLITDNPQYFAMIREDILYDPDFVLDPKGVYTIDTQYGYSVVVFGTSKNYNGGRESVKCDEIRLYNLFCDYDIMGNIMKYANAGMDERIFYYYAADRKAYIAFDSTAISSYVQQSAPADSEGGPDDYISRMLQYIGGS